MAGLPTALLFLTCSGMISAVAIAFALAEPYVAGFLRPSSMQDAVTVSWLGGRSMTICRYAQSRHAARSLGWGPKGRAGERWRELVRRVVGAVRYAMKRKGERGEREMDREMMPSPRLGSYSRCVVTVADLFGLIGLLLAEVSAKLLQQVCPDACYSQLLLLLLLLPLLLLLLL